MESRIQVKIAQPDLKDVTASRQVKVNVIQSRRCIHQLARFFAVDEHSKRKLLYALM